MFAPRLHPRRFTALLTTAAAALALAACGSTSATSASGGGAASGSSKGGSITIGELYPFTGAKAELSGWGIHGVGAAVKEINAAGGVDGKQIKTVTGDDAADSVDALPALRKMLLSNPVAVIGPFSPTIEAVIHQFQANNVVDFALGGTAQLDDMNFPYVFRTFPSDSTEATAMAIHAIQSGYKSASLIFDNSANSQGFVPPLTKAYEKLGGKVLSVQSIVPDQGSYRSELEKAFANHPQIVFASFDTQTATTIWADAKQLGDLSVPWQGDDLMAGADYAHAFGAAASSKLFAALPAPPTGAGYQEFLAAYKAAYPGATPLPSTYNIYDSVVIAALAMDKAKSTDPKQWVKDVMSVASPPGTACSDYPTCAKLIAAGKEINYEGAGGSDDFN
ncbi:MAG: ABC transporter substrate-binding protein, partial [Solirubrobacteraceae bacterium]